MLELLVASLGKGYGAHNTSTATFYTTLSLTLRLPASAPGPVNLMSLNVDGTGVPTTLVVVGPLMIAPGRSYTVELPGLFEADSPPVISLRGPGGEVRVLHIDAGSLAGTTGVTKVLAKATKVVLKNGNVYDYNQSIQSMLIELEAQGDDGTGRGNRYELRETIQGAWGIHTDNSGVFEVPPLEAHSYIDTIFSARVGVGLGEFGINGETTYLNEIPVKTLRTLRGGISVTGLVHSAPANKEFEVTIHMSAQSCPVVIH